MKVKRKNEETQDELVITVMTYESDKNDRIEWLDSITFTVS